MKLKRIVQVCVVIGLAFLANSCKKDSSAVNDPPGGNDPELITTVKVVLSDSLNAAQVVKATWRDFDGDGGNPPSQIDTLRLPAGHTFFGQIVLLREQNNMVDTVSNEVRAEQNDHFFYFKANGAKIDVRYADFDTHAPPLPLGLKSVWQVGSASQGSMRIVLRHQPGIKDGTYTPGETDLDVSFPAVVY